MPKESSVALSLDISLLQPGLRLGVAVSGGADSIALLCALDEARALLGLVLTVLHVHHGIRGEEAEADARFVEALAGRLSLRFLRKDVDTPARAKAEQETVEEAARHLRYSWFDELLAGRELDAIATAHTLDDQAETVLLKLLRGAWTEGLAGIFPVVDRPAGGRILRPLLMARRSEIEARLKAIGQAWREDSTNREDIYTRNRVRHRLMPILAEYNPQIAPILAQTAAIARDEEAYWSAELARILPSLLLPGRAVRGGGRSSSTLPGEASISIEVERLRPLHPAVRKRVLRAAAEQLGCALNFQQVQALLAMAEGKAGQKQELAGNLLAERTPRELRLIRRPPQEALLPEYEVSIPGEVLAKAFGICVSVTAQSMPEMYPHATLRAHQPGDRVRLRHTRAPKRVKEVLERLEVPPAERKAWPVLAWQGEIVWMRGVELESSAGAAAGLKVEWTELAEDAV